MPNRFTEDEESRFQFVSSVIFSHEPVIDLSAIRQFDPNSPDPQPQLPPPPEIEIKLPNEQIGFIPDRAEFLNENAARQWLAPLARDLRNFFDIYPDEVILVVGTTAAVSNDRSCGIDLAMRRAETVRNTLINEFELSVYADNLFVIGLGSRFPWAVNERPHGSFDTNIAQENRAVWLLANNEDTEKFVRLRTAYNNSELLPEAIARFRVLESR